MLAVNPEFHLFNENSAKLCHHFYMGNKDARKRETKKPKKQTPKLVPQRREPHQVVTDATKRTPNT
ncbi:MAG: hypothetical protein NVS9B14_20040 [Candidatus Acidiferrum sp.]